MNKKIFIFLIYLLFYPLPVLAHNITGKVGFKGKKKFKSRNNRPKKFSFKKHSKKRAKY